MSSYNFRFAIEDAMLSVASMLMLIALAAHPLMAACFECTLKSCSQAGASGNQIHYKCVNDGGTFACCSNSNEPCYLNFSANCGYASFGCSWSISSDCGGGFSSYTAECSECT